MPHSPHRPIGSLQGADAQWAWAVVHRLTHNEVNHATVNRTVDHLHRVVAAHGQGSLPHTLGDPYRFADVVTRNPEAVFAAQEAQARKNESVVSLGKRIGDPVHTGGIALVFVLFLGFWTGALTGLMFRNGTASTPLTTGFLFTIVACVAFFAVVLAAPARWTLRHPIVSIFAWVLYFIIVILVGILWAQPVVMLPRVLIALAAVVLSIGGAITAWILAAQAKRRATHGKHIVGHLRFLGFFTLIGTWAMALILYFDIDLSMYN